MHVTSPKSLAPGLHSISLAPIGFHIETARISKLLLSLVCIASLSACVVVVAPPDSRSSQVEPGFTPAVSSSAEPPAVHTAADGCIGANTLPAQVASAFVEVQDAALLAQAVQPPTKGGLCQAKVYQSTAPVMIYRAWNSTNPGSRIGSWWAFEKASGSVSQYRRDYEICTQYSPLDSLTQCKLKTGSVIVVGTGQSAQCDQYLTYPTSASLQIYMPKDKANVSVNNCEDFDGEFAWKAKPGVR